MRAGVKRQVCTTLATPNFSGSIQVLAKVAPLSSKR